MDGFSLHANIFFGDEDGVAIHTKNKQTRKCGIFNQQKDKGC